MGNNRGQYASSRIQSSCKIEIVDNGVVRAEMSASVYKMAIDDKK